MTSKEQAFKMIEGRIETIQNLSLEIIEHIYLAAYNEAIEAAAKECKDFDYGISPKDIAMEIRKLRK